MSATVVFDCSRLSLRFNRSAPSGIDRIDLACARHFIATDAAAQSVLLTVLGPRAVPARAARTVIETLQAHWGETDAADPDQAIQSVRDRILGRHQTPRTVPQRQPRAANHARTALAALRVSRDAPLLGPRGLFPGREPGRAIPTGAIYLNFSQFPLALPGACRWLEQRPDIKPVIMLHDMLPITHPEFFPPAERTQHLRFVERTARLARIVIVTGEPTRDAVTRHLTDARLRVPPIEVVPLAVDPIFTAPRTIDPDLAARPYFVVCGTIEPRKNHLFLLTVWHELVRAHGPSTPKLVIVGQRGWENENVIDMLQRCEPLGPHVIEASNLTTPALKRLIDNARGLLMPSFAEGFGLPVAEALAAGAPVLASDIPAFRGLNDSRLTLIDPIDGLSWQREIVRHAGSPRAEEQRDHQPRTAQSSQSCFFSHIEQLFGQI